MACSRVRAFIRAYFRFTKQQASYGSSRGTLWGERTNSVGRRGHGQNKIPRNSKDIRPMVNKSELLGTWRRHKVKFRHHEHLQSWFISSRHKFFPAAVSEREKKPYSWYAHGERSGVYTNRTPFTRYCVSADQNPDSNQDQNLQCCYLHSIIVWGQTSALLPHVVEGQP